MDVGSGTYVKRSSVPLTAKIGCQFGSLMAKPGFKVTPLTMLRTMTTVSPMAGVYRAGKLEQLKVTPETRKKDVVIVETL